MPLEPYRRGRIWWVRGRVELNGRAITGPYRKSTGALDEAGARDWIAQETELQRRRHYSGKEKVFHFRDAVNLYPASPRAARQLLPVLDEIGDMLVSEITGKFLKSLGPKLRPNASTDTWWREIVTPARAVINHAHEVVGTPLLRVTRYTQFEMIGQDRKRNRQSRVERTPSDNAWIEAFCAAADPYNAALVRFMRETAARIDQAVSITPDDLRPDERKVRLKAQKGHAECWVTVTPEMMREIMALKPKRPRNRRTGKLLSPRVFGYGSSTGYNNRWRTICKRAEIPYLSAHAAGRHGYYTELVVRRGVDPVTAAKLGRWSDVSLPLRIYAHAELPEEDIRALFRTNQVQVSAASPDKSMI